MRARLPELRMSLRSALGALGLALILLPGSAPAVLEVDIVDGVEGTLPIAVVPFAWQGAGDAPATAVGEVIHSDLARSGQFEPLPRGDVVERPQDGSEINFGTWRMLEVDHLVIGRVQPNQPGYRVTFELYDVHSQERLAGQRFDVPAGRLRDIAHRVSDIVFETLLGVPGAFSTDIAYVTARSSGESKRYALRVADADGYGPQTVFRSNEPIMSPAWSPDGKRLAYVSFESGNGVVYIQEIASGSRRKVADFEGINGAPAFSPDGRRLAVTLSRSGNPEIAVMDLATGDITQVTRHFGIDTEPAWLPGGDALIFTSDRGGRPQLYRKAADGSGSAQRLTFDGEYNAKPSVGPQGERVALVHGEGDTYRIGLLELDSGVLRVLSDGPMDESPSFAPNGSMILFTSRRGERDVLNAITPQGRVPHSLKLPDGDVREPAWSP